MNSSDLPAADPVLNNRSVDAICEHRRALAWPVKWGIRLENAIIIIALSAMVLFPVWESVIRVIKRWNWVGDWSNHLSITASAVFVQHGTLIVGLIGAAIAARENRLLSLATASIFPNGWPRSIARVIAAAVGAAISAMLCMASWQFVSVERSSESGNQLVGYGIQKWMMAASLPIGFGLITLSVLYHSTERWRRRWIAPLIAAAIIAFFGMTQIDPERLTIPAFAVLLVATILGAPIFAILGGSALILFWSEGGGETLERISSIPLDHYALVTNAALPTIPLFTLAGYFLAEGGASKRLVRVFSTLFGSIPGGPAIVTALLCAFFTSFTGASGVTILALGGVLMPVLLSARYSPRASLGLLTGAGSLGMLFPPCLPLVLYAIIARQPIEDIFVGAIIPGALLVIMTAILGIWMGPSRRDKEQRGFPVVNPNDSDARVEIVEPPPKFNAAEAGKALWAAKWELLIPVVAMYALFSGRATPVEAAAYTALYAFLTQTIFHRDLTFRRGVPHVLVECGLVIGGVLLILGVAQGFTNYLITAQIPDRAIVWLTQSVKSPYAFLLLLNLFLLVVGGLMDVYPAIVVIVPLMVPIGEAFGIHPIHLGVIFLANLEMGFLMPPLGMNLLLASYRFGRPIPEVYRAILPLLVVQFIGVLLITYVPILSTGAPQLYEKWKQRQQESPAAIEKKPSDTAGIPPAFSLIGDRFDGPPADVHHLLLG